jgi:hypothetical protein
LAYFFLTTLISSIAASSLNAIFFPDEFFYLFAGTLCFVFNFVGCLLCGIVRIVLKKYQMHTSIVIPFIVFNVAGVGYYVLLTSGKLQDITVVGFFIGTSYFVTDFLIKKRIFKN